MSAVPSETAGASLDAPQRWAAFSAPVDEAVPGGEQESHIAIDGMYCAACSLTVEAALRSVPGVRDAAVNAASHVARVVWSPTATRPSQWMGAVERAGYRAAPLDEGARYEAGVQDRRKLLWRVLVAAFCMMQVMMYATPVYVAAPGEMTAEALGLLRWASWVLTLPVLLFSCRPFFESAWRDLRHGVIGMDVPVTLGILVAFAASTAVTFSSGGALHGEVWFDSITMFVFFLLTGRLLERQLRDRTAGALEALSRRLPQTVLRRQADGGFDRVPVADVAPGDVLRVLPGESFAADGVLLEGETQADEALLTGESRPLARAPGMQVLAGSHNLTATVLMEARQTGRDTRYAGIVALMREAASAKPDVVRLADRVARPFLIAVLAAAALAGVAWWFIDAERAIGVAVAVLIVTCPCALSLAAPAASLAAAGALARRGILVRDLRALEACAAVDTLVFDKTGTLTSERIGVGAIRVRPGLSQAEALRLAAALARHSLHPASQAIAARAADLSDESDPSVPAEATQVTELPGQGVRGEVGGLDLRLGSAPFCGIDAPRHRDGVAAVHLADATGWLASFDLDEVVRADAVPAVAALRASGLRVQLLSGDQTQAAERMGWRLGIDWALGDRTPQDKLDHVAFLQQGGHRVMMVGDGINDAPVLARADVSVSFAQAAPVSRARADVVLMGESLSAVPVLVEQARRMRRVVRQNLSWAAAYNAVCVPLALVGWMPPWLAGLGMALSSFAVVANSARLSRLSAPMAGTSVPEPAGPDLRA